MNTRESSRLTVDRGRVSTLLMLLSTRAGLYGMPFSMSVSSSNSNRIVEAKSKKYPNGIEVLTDD
jgi:hypothetical protein